MHFRKEPAGTQAGKHAVDIDREEISVFQNDQNSEIDDQDQNQDPLFLPLAV